MTVTAAPASLSPCPYSDGKRCEQSEIWRSAEIAVDRVTENWIAERRKREEVEAALSAARRHIATLERAARRATAQEQAELARNIAD